MAKIQHLALMSRNPRELAEFYSDVFGLKISGFLAWIFWIFLHIFWLIGFRNRFVVMTEWAWAYFSLQRRVRLITGESAGVSPPSAP